MAWQWSTDSTEGCLDHCCHDLSLWDSISRVDSRLSSTHESQTGVLLSLFLEIKLNPASNMCCYYLSNDLGLIYPTTFVTSEGEFS